MLPFFNANILKTHSFWMKADDRVINYEPFQFPDGLRPNISDPNTYENTTGVNIDEIMQMAEKLLDEINKDKTQFTIYFENEI